MEYLSASKERMFKALLGQQPDRLPAAPCYLSLFLADQIRAGYIEQYHQRMKGRSRYPVDHAEDTQFRAQALYRAYGIFKSPPDWIEVDTGGSKAWAERTEIVLRDGTLFYHDTLSGERAPMHSLPIPRGNVLLSGMQSVVHDVWDRSNQISSPEDADVHTPVLSAEEWLARGDFDLPRQVAADYGDRFFVSTILDTPYSDAYDLLGFRGADGFPAPQPWLTSLPVGA